jgi:hypothetical protein
VFTELPPDRADSAPEKPEFLSNVTSRARDRVPGGDTDLPNLQGESDAPHVRLESGGSPSRPSAAAPSNAPSAESEAARESDAPGTEGSEGQGNGSADVGSASQRAGDAPIVPLPSDDAIRGPGGSASTDQPEMSNPRGNASLLGEVSLSTTAWDYAPWLQRFGIQLRERWYAPPAYLLGILKEGGWGVFELEIAKSGKVLRMHRLEQQGHDSLVRSAEGALRRMDPTEPLPGDFPEPTLTLRIRMIYPKIRPR